MVTLFGYEIYHVLPQMGTWLFEAVIGIVEPEMKLIAETQRAQRNPKKKGGRGDIKSLSLRPLCDLCASAVKNLTVPGISWKEEA